jgi:hypothetical protein
VALERVRVRAEAEEPAAEDGGGEAAAASLCRELSAGWH